MSLLPPQYITLVFFGSTILVNVDDSRLSMAAQQHRMAEAPSSTLRPDRPRLQMPCESPDTMLEIPPNRQPLQGQYF